MLLFERSSASVSRFAPPLRAFLALAFMLATLCGILTVVGIWLLVGRASVEAIVAGQLRETAVEAAQALKDNLSERRREIEIAATEASASLDQPGALRLLLRRIQEASPFYTLIGFVDPLGTFAVTSNRLAEGVNVSNRDYFRMGRRRTFVSDAHAAVLLDKAWDQSDGAPRLIDIATPVYRGDQFAGVLAAHLTTDWAKDLGAGLAKRALARLPGARLQIVDAAGDEIFTAGPARSENSEDLLASAKVASVGQDSGLNWTVEVREPRQLALSLTRQLRTFVIAAAVAVLGLSGAIGWGLGSRLARPLEGYAADAVALSQGAIPVFRGAPSREINDLGAALQLAADELGRGDAAVSGRAARPLDATRTR